MHKSPLRSFHADHGAQMVEYAGWEMPLRYPAGVLAEHHQVRNSGGIFDVSHMGRVEFKGRHARRLLERLCTRRVHDMQEGQARYSLVCNEQGGVKDDVLIYRMDDDKFMLVVNAANREKLLNHFEEVRAAGELSCSIDDQTLKTAMVAIQGPKVMDLISRVSSEIPKLKRYRFTVKNLMIVKLIVSRTGYTGEDGVEVILPANAIGMALKLLMKDIDPNADDAPIKPAGLAARDSLRTEAGMPLYGHELGEDINALSCGVNFAINMDKADDERGEPFIGLEALQKTQAEGGPARMLVGLKLDGKRSPRQGHAVYAGDQQIGEITSGCLSPTLGYPIAMAMVAREHAEPGQSLSVDIGRVDLDAQTVPMPFYKAPKP